MTYLITSIFILFGCFSNRGEMKTLANQKTPINVAIERARLKISTHLRDNGINLEDKSMVFYAYVQPTSDNRGELCKLLYHKQSYDFISKNLVIGVNWVNAMVIDVKGDYIVKSSPHTLIKNPSQLSTYSIELKMIELAQNNDYITFIKLFGCSENLILGYKNDTVDVYELVESGLNLIYKIHK